MTVVISWPICKTTSPINWKMTVCWFQTKMHKFICSSEPCAFVTENNKCCKLPFEFNNRNYTECTADVTEKKWGDQWRNPWCFPEGGDRSTKHPCYRSGWLSLYSDNFSRRMNMFKKQLFADKFFTEKNTFFPDILKWEIKTDKSTSSVVYFL